MKSRLNAIVSGRVQGVIFRYSTVENANSLGLSGWVRNTRDGRVEVLAEGEKEDLDRLLVFLRKGPSPAKVTSVDVKWDEYKGDFSSFKIR
jgi:acylphosphatase